MKSPLKLSAFTIPVRIYYEDTDAGGVVYYANYLKFLERCRSEWLRAIGHQQAELLRDPGIAFVVRSVQVDFLKPARLDDQLLVDLEVEKISRAQIFFASTIRRADESLAGGWVNCSAATVHLVCVNAAQMKPLRFPHFCGPNWKHCNERLARPLDPAPDPQRQRRRAGGHAVAGRCFVHVLVLHFPQVVHGQERRAQTEQFERDFWSGGDLNSLYQSAINDRHSTGSMERIFEAGFREFTKLRSQKHLDAKDVIDGSRRAMRATYQREMDSIDSHLAFLASVGSVSPYVGLFGTVWGIMHSFRGLANVGQATLSAVAPGIAEALVATAIGLFAAIPAVVAYNRFAHEIDRLSSRFESFMEEFSNILQRQMR
jgi:biopolymer transport protein TolQ